MSREARSASPPIKRPKSRKACLSTLAEVGALPPASDDDMGDDEAPTRDVDVMSEPPEIDTSRFDGPPLVRLCGVGVQPIATHLFFATAVLTLLPVGAFLLCLSFEKLRDHSAVMQETISLVYNETSALLGNVETLVG